MIEAKAKRFPAISAMVAERQAAVFEARKKASELESTLEIIQKQSSEAYSYLTSSQALKSVFRDAAEHIAEAYPDRLLTISNPKKQKRVNISELTVLSLVWDFVKTLDDYEGFRNLSYKEVSCCVTRDKSEAINGVRFIETGVGVEEGIDFESRLAQAFDEASQSPRKKIQHFVTGMEHDEFMSRIRYIP